MSGFKDLDIRHSYTGRGDRILRDFLLPVLDAAVSYDRITSYYTIESLLAIALGVQSLYERGGSMRLIIGVHSFPPDLANAFVRRSYLEEQVRVVRDDIERGLSSIGDMLTRKRLATLAWMIEDGLLAVKAASVEGDGIFHPKTLIFADASGDEIAAVGSSNETRSGLGGNFEQLMVASSWTLADAVDDQKRLFEMLWNNESEDAVVCDVNDELLESLNTALGGDCKRIPKAKLQDGIEDGIISLAARMPANFFVSGIVPALYQHQERAVVQALSRWPIRVLFADEVGLGKTFEVGATLAFLRRYCGVGRALVLTPKSVLQQWQDELSEHFGIDAWVFDSQKRVYVSATGRRLRVGDGNPLGKGSPDTILMSAQYARGGAGRSDVFSREGTILPDVLMVDEAHSARVSKDISGKRKATRMYRMLEGVVRKVPHVIFATATPMQRDAEEYHALLSLLGLTKIWERPDYYRTSLNLTACDELTGLDEAARAGKLLRSILHTAKPDLALLTPEEKVAVRGLEELDAHVGSFGIAEYVLGVWNSLHGAFVKLHPAHLLTVRNTRGSLEQIGYHFPQRNLRDVTVNAPTAVLLFYLKVNEYIDEWYFSVEKALHPERKLNVGFVRVGYQQRVSSSLWSCRKSLERRLSKMLELRGQLSKQGIIPKQMLATCDISSELDAFAEDELLTLGDETMFDDDALTSVDLNQLLRAIDMECTTLHPLIKRADALLHDFGDVKVSTSIRLAMRHLGRGDQVLLFSRYTDTVNALVDEFRAIEGDKTYPYGIYIGNQASIVSGGVAVECTKREIKQGLNSGHVRLMFCSDAASEGLNLQAARVLINVDVPWTPSRLEQRIGRVARLGQRSKSVDIYNVWYPNSIESRMYKRIQKRLDEATLAIGEYPDVVADNIKAMVLEDSEDDVVSERLAEVRSSMQIDALSRLWSQHDSRVTTSGFVRRGLMELCEATFECEGTQLDDTIREYRVSDELVPLTALEGYAESVSLSSKPWRILDFALGPSLAVRYDCGGNPAAFAQRDDSSALLSHECIVDLILQRPIRASFVDNRYPSMLPDMDALDLSFAVDCDMPERPVFWPPVSEE